LQALEDCVGLVADARSIKTLTAEATPSSELPIVGCQSKAPNCDGRHWRCQATGNMCRPQQINPSKGNLLSMEGNMIDALLNVAIFAALVLCIVAFSAWAHKRVDAQ
jgi:hypothetical protein